MLESTVSENEAHQIPVEYKWIQKGEKARHVSMSQNVVFEIDGSPRLNDDLEWVVMVLPLKAELRCDSLLDLSNLTLSDDDNWFEPYCVGERSDGVWECFHGYIEDAEVTTGKTKVEALKRMIWRLDNMYGDLLDYTMFKSGLSNLKKALAAMARHADSIDLAKDPHHQKNQMQNRFAIALVEICGALEAGDA